MDKYDVMPHCDTSILHAPGVCKFCDKLPEAQAYRKAARINFTGKNYPDLAPCPSTHFRGESQRDRWYGNVAEPYDPS